MSSATTTTTPTTLSLKIQDCFDQEISSITSRQKKNRIHQIVKKFEELKINLQDCKPAADIRAEPWFFPSGCEDCTFEKEDIETAIKDLDEKMSSATKPFVETTFFCVCGSEISITAKPKHFKSSKHKRYEETIELQKDRDTYKDKYDELRQQIIPFVGEFNKLAELKEQPQKPDEEKEQSGEGKEQSGEEKEQSGEEKEQSGEEKEQSEAKDTKEENGKEES